jgi:hypothetical protein
LEPGGQCDKKLDFLDGHVNKHGEERNAMDTRRDSKRLVIDANNGQGCEADDGYVLRFDERGVDKVTQRTTSKTPFI